VGLMSAAEATRARPHHRHVIEAMTPTDDAPAIDWSTLGEAQVADLLEIFEGTGVEHLVVIESQGALLNSVRGLVNRERLWRSLQSPWSLHNGVM
jgi:hypothetical protein